MTEKVKMTNNPVLVTCKRCGRQSPADGFTLDPIFKMVVCAACVKERKAKGITTEKPIVQSSDVKPAGWDEEDEYLEKVAKKKEPRPAASDKVRVKCRKCGYAFDYNLGTKTPAHCPYCNAEVVGG